jgi:hypothetical protein
MIITNLENFEKTLKLQFELLYEGICPQKSVKTMFYLKDQIDMTQLHIKFQPKQITESKFMTPENPCITRALGPLLYF